MTGTDQLGANTSDGKLAVLMERTKNTEEYIKASAHAFTTLAEVVNRIEKSQIQTNEILTARSEANKKAIETLDAKVDHKAGSSVQRDQQQVRMIRDEETARDKALKEQQERHDADLAEIRETIKEMSIKLDNAVFWARIMAGVAAFAVVLGGAAFSAYLRTIFP